MDAAAPVVSQRRPMLSYDFSKWEGGDDTIRDEAEPSADAEPIPVSFRVYTPREIKERPLVKTAPPPVDTGLANVSDVVEVARSFGTRGLVTRVAIGAAGALLAVGLVALAASLADDTPSRSSAPALPTATMLPVADRAPAVAPPAPVVVVTSAPVVTAAPAAAPPAVEEPAFELPDVPGRPRPRASRPRISPSQAASNAKHIIRDNPY